MSVDIQTAIKVIFATIDELNETLPNDRQLDKSSETRLFGSQGGLKSLEFVNFIVLLEQRIEEELGFAITLADERAISREASPFSTVQRLAEYAVQLITDQTNE